MDELDFKGAALWLLGVLMAILAWLGRQGWKRLERLEDEMVKRSTLLSMHEENKAQSRELRKMLEEQNERSANWRRHLSVAIARLEENIEIRNGDPSGNTGRFRRGDE